ncbi:MAG: AAA family ATPase [Bacteroidales bacterium]|nr:AAA family ATPase [Bacteroidales bacterium]
MKQISIIAAKGGVGKTAISAAFASFAKDLILVDCDTESSDLRVLLNAKTKETTIAETMQRVRIEEDECIRCGLCKAMCHFDAIINPYGIYQIKEEHCQACNLCHKACPVSAIEYVQSEKNIWGLAESRYGDLFYAQLALGEDLNGSLITILRERARELAQDKKTDMILIDGPPAMGFAVASAIALSSLTVVVVEPVPSAIHDLHKSIQLAKRYDVPSVCLINKSDLNIEMTNQLKEYCIVNDITVIGEIPFDIQFMQAQLASKTMPDYAPDSKSTLLLKQSFNQICDLN